METYLKRTYKQRMAKSKGRQPAVDDKSFPFWDYRSRRGSFSASTCTSSSGSSHDGCSLSSLTSGRSADTVSIGSSGSSGSSSDSDSGMSQLGPSRLSLVLDVDSHEILPLVDLYQPIINWVDQDLHFVKVTERTNNDRCNTSVFQPKKTSRIPSVAVMLFLEEEGVIGYERIQTARRHFEKSPWKFHHSEQVGNGKINPYPYNSQDYFYSSEGLPLWAVRQVHYGKEHLRIVLFTSMDNWEDMLHFYKLVVGVEPDIQRDDFCLFTVHSHANYDVQLALKKLKGETRPRVLDCVKLNFRVAQVGNLVPLFPNVCKPVSDKTWETTDHDGNTVLLDVIRGPRSTSSSTSSGSSIRSRASRRSSQSSVQSLNSVQSLTSVTSSAPSSVSSSVTSASSDVSKFTNSSAEDNNTPATSARDHSEPPALPPRGLKPPKLPPKPKHCAGTLRGFYV